MFVEAILAVINAVGCFERYRRYIVQENGPEEYDREIAPSRHDVPSDITRNSDTQAISLEQSSHAALAERELVRAENADIGWDDEKAVISNATFTIREGSLTVVQGGLASGKSTLLKALLGLGVVQKGSLISRFTNAGYSSQEPWLLKGTVRQNVIGPSTFDPPWYEMVLESCALNMDISRMGQGDETLIGGDGIRLSGGQQSRLVGSTSFCQHFPGS
jgi:ATP-binding cassette, subfamily C (CFTR/MRP), member 1